ncbi:hypothetical protein [Vagococcus xieshaowenii]|uniref:Phage protein n=1 Tax=Vagococcus xieshaowenii TaxID=2562451 RepID=A0AAJ5EEI7_9ENTE|nr:hypothetical protein [Vagococcus xieshaowenii]QCA28258.1 hypothetical protein E4Z98_02605 [Vagococcus xieshaowenii]TFZ41912.1 hypothetical protein E4031_04785 [Vagococcus xieshaowenii]
MAKKLTSSGFAYVLEKERLDNYELLEAISEIEEDPTVVPKVIKLLLGKEQAQVLKDHVRDEKGFVPAEKMMAELQEIFETQAKNS